MNSALPCSTWFPLAETISLEPQGPHPDVSPPECPQSPVSSFGEVGEASSCLTFVISNPPGFLKSRLQTKYPKPSFSRILWARPLAKAQMQHCLVVCRKGGSQGSKEHERELGGGELVTISKIYDITQFCSHSLLCLIRQRAFCKLELCVTVFAFKACIGPHFW